MACHPKTGAGQEGVSVLGALGGREGGLYGERGDAREGGVLDAEQLVQDLLDCAIGRGRAGGDADGDGAVAKPGLRLHELAVRQLVRDAVALHIHARRRVHPVRRHTRHLRNFLGIMCTRFDLLACKNLYVISRSQGVTERRA